VASLVDLHRGKRHLTARVPRPGALNHNPRHAPIVEAERDSKGIQGGFDEIIDVAALFIQARVTRSVNSSGPSGTHPAVIGSFQLSPRSQPPPGTPSASADRALPPRFVVTYM
jgi:hypothetical protein